MTLKNGSKIKTTNNHKFPTSNGLKRLDKINLKKDLIYTKGNYRNNGEKGSYTNLIEIDSIISIGKEEVYDVEMENPNHTFVTKSGIVTCNSHSAAYALTAYISMYLKVHFPLEFWTV